MRVNINTWRGWQEMELAQALEPQGHDRDGVAERAQAQADENAKAIGKLAALLVERHLLTLDEAAEACGIYDTITIVKEPA